MNKYYTIYNPLRQEYLKALTKLKTTSMNKIKTIPYLIETFENNPTKVQITKMPQTGKLVAHCAGGEFRKYLSMGYKSQHLYLTTDEEIKEGDWRLYYNTLKIAKTTKEDLPIIKYYSEECRKIVATTDQELCMKLKDSFPNKETAVKYWNEPIIFKIPESFINQYIERYNAGNKIEKMWLQSVLGTYEHEGKIYHQGGVMVPRINPEGYVIPVEEKEKLYTREELKEILLPYWNKLHGMTPEPVLLFSDDRRIQLYSEWFNKNYPE